MSENLYQTPQTAAIVEKITIFGAYKAKTMAKNAMPKIARSPRQKSNFPPTIAIDIHIITVKRDSINPFPQNIEFTRL